LVSARRPYRQARRLGYAFHTNAPWQKSGLSFAESSGYLPHLQFKPNPIMNATLTATDEKPEFMLIFRDTELESRLPDDKVEESMRRFNDWLERWSTRGCIKSGQPLATEGRVLAKSQERVVTDGPFAESKEVVGGYIIVFADNLDEATKIAEDWPLMDYGATVEVRPILTFCPAMKKVGLEHYPVAS
jgi:hypothetical protein